jgi:hypothetical protein
MGAVVIFTHDVKSLSRFYVNVLGGIETHESSGDVRVISATEEVIVHAIPPRLSTQFPKTQPSSPREDVSLKQCPM